MDNVPENIQPEAPEEQAKEARGILDLLLAEARTRLTDPKHLRKLSTAEILTHIEKILLAVKKNSVILSKKTTVNLGKLHERAQVLDAHPVRNREEVRAEVRAAKIGRIASR